MDLGSGLMSSPMGIVATPPALSPWMSPQLVGLDVDGTGLMSSPMGVQTMTVAQLLPPTDKDIAADGSGLMSSPMLGFRPQVGIIGSSGPLGFDVYALVEPDAAPDVDAVLPRYDRQLVRLDEGSVEGMADATALQSHLDEGAWQEHGVGGASALIGNGQVSADLDGSGTTGEPIEVSE